MGERPGEYLPFDMGVDAYRSRLLLEDNPFAEECWQHREWMLGWMDAEETDSDSQYDWGTGQFKQSEK
ncbi:hypothetical protein SAMN02745129_2530 [Ferrimonas marina]|uniref:Uncharacterized protein n=1 Tax=Ferrimonas marina TaxID=299255 RepID=A0A1M5UER5_9GAMM|nr:hypothetical protein SAMN02745129_2530 [Ferrimonas marina]